MRNITTNEFDQIILSEKRVIVDFGAEWCSPCRMLHPILQSIEDSNEEIAVFQVDVDEETELASRFGIRNIPTLLYYRDGELINKSVGSLPKHMILDKFKSIE